MLKTVRQPATIANPITLVELEISTPLANVSGSEPIRQGIPLAAGAVTDESRIGVVDESGYSIPIQSRVLSRWSDGSIQWLLLDFFHQFDALAETKQQSDVGPVRSSYRVTLDAPKPDHQLVHTSQTDSAVGSDELRKSIIAKSIWGRVVFAPRGEPENRIFQIEDQYRAICIVRLTDGRDLRLIFDDCRLIETGSIRTVVELCGSLIDNSGVTVLKCRVETHVLADSPLMRLSVTFQNPAAATHPAGIWELGDPRSVEIAEASIVLRPVAGRFCDNSARVCFSLDGTTRCESSGLPWSLYQDSSGGEAWDCSNHVDKNGQVPLRFSGYRLLASGAPEQTKMGLRATPFAEIRSQTGSIIGVSFARFWQNFPKSLTLSDSELRIGLFPAESDRPHELQGGEQKTHQFWLGSPASDDSGSPWPTNPVLSVHCPSTVSIDPGAISASGVIPWLTPKSSDPHSTYLSLVDAAIEGDDTFFHKREKIDEYGWRHFGDAYGDHEAVFLDSDKPLVSHYNNQYDIVLGFGIQFLRACDNRWFELMRDQAWHVVDIDIYHAKSDKKAYNGGQFWHTFHYVDAGTATHRSYPKGTCGGGPASEQGYARGLGLYYFLTGEEMMRQTVDRMGDWIIAADDGTTTPFRWLSKQGTGVTSASGTLDYQGPGRGAGNAIELLVAAFEVTGKKKFLEEAEKLVARVIHPNDDIASRNLLDAERRWYYTLFLQSLGRYLWIKHQLGQHDRMYGYGRASLLHYSSWMIDNEYPYLEKPEILEYPTETWAAQDIRKCEVFQWASLHATGPQREQLLKKAKYFFDYSTETLAGMETRTLCRPVALMLSNGYSRAWFACQSEIPTLPPASKGVSGDYGQPKRFVPQKIQALSRARAIAGIGTGLALIGIVAGFFIWLT